MATAGEIVTRVSTASGRSDLSTDMLVILNELILTISIEFNLPLQEQIRTRATVAGSDRYALPADQIDWKALFLVGTDGISSTELLVRNRGDLEVLYGLSTATADRGLPSFVAYEKNEYMLRPVPDSSSYTMRLHYYAAPATMVSGTSNHFTSQWAFVLELGLLSRVYLQIGNEKLFDFWNKKFMEAYGRMRMAVRKQQLKSSPSLPIRSGPVASPSTASSALPGYPWWGKW